MNLRILSENTAGCAAPTPNNPAFEPKQYTHTPEACRPHWMGAPIPWMLVLPEAESIWTAVT